MSTPTPRTLLHFLETLDWTGHVELSRKDLQWLASALAARLSPDKDMCGVCGVLANIIVRTALGNMCPDCIEEAQEDADEIREQLEGK